MRHALLLFASAASVFSPAGRGPSEGGWKRAAFPEICPRSCAGGDNGGAGRLDYLESLGGDAIGLTPMSPSPQADFACGVSDHGGFGPRCGSPWAPGPRRPLPEGSCATGSGPWLQSFARKGEPG